MPEEQIKERAEKYARKYIKHRMAVHDIFEAEVVQKDVTKLLVVFTKELSEKLEESERRVANYRTWGDKIKALKCVKIGKCAGELQELKEQIEKMKCCFNCKHSRTEYEHCKTDKHEKWEMKE